MVPGGKLRCPDEVDLEVRLLNGRLLNFLASARAFVDSVPARFGRAGEPLSGKFRNLKAFFSEQFDADFSYRHHGCTKESYSPRCRASPKPHHDPHLALCTG
jgi:hypothetical protein